MRGVEKKTMTVRAPLDVVSWINAQAERNASSQSSEIVRLIRDRIEREQAEQREQAVR
jgi:hypothetical protein